MFTALLTDVENVSVPITYSETFQSCNSFRFTIIVRSVNARPPQVFLQTSALLQHRCPDVFDKAAPWCDLQDVWNSELWAPFAAKVVRGYETAADMRAELQYA